MEKKHNKTYKLKKSKKSMKMEERSISQKITMKEPEFKIKTINGVKSLEVKIPEVVKQELRQIVIATSGAMPSI